MRLANRSKEQNRYPRRGVQKDVDDPRESPSFKLMELLMEVVPTSVTSIRTFHIAFHATL